MTTINYTGELASYNRDLDRATQLIIQARVAEGQHSIATRYLYDVLGAATPAAKTSVRWGIRACKNAGLIVHAGKRGVYNVV